MTALPDNPQASGPKIPGAGKPYAMVEPGEASGGAQAASEGSEQKRCGGSGRIMTHRDDPRGPQANRLPDSTAGGSVFSCPGCPDCQAASGEGGERWEICARCNVVLASEDEGACGCNLYGKESLRVEVCRASALTAAEKRAEEAERNRDAAIRVLNEVRAGEEGRIRQWAEQRARADSLATQLRSAESALQELVEAVEAAIAVLESPDTSGPGTRFHATKLRAATDRAEGERS